MTRNPNVITVKRKTTLLFSPLKFQFHDSRGRRRPEERPTMKAKQHGAKPSNDDVDLESTPTLPKASLNIPTNAHRKRRCYGIQSVAERKERRRATRARGKHNAQSDRSVGKENVAPAKNKFRIESDDCFDDGAFYLDENPLEGDASSSIRGTKKLLSGSNESASDSEKESENTDDDDESPVKQRRLFSIAKKRRFILEEDSTDDEEVDGGAEKKDDEFVFDQDEVKRIKGEKDGKGMRNNIAMSLRGRMMSNASKYQIPTKNSTIIKTRKRACIADNANPSSSKEIPSKQKQTKDQQKTSPVKSAPLEKQHARIIGKSAMAKSPYAQEMYAKAAAATLAEDSNDKRVNHLLAKKITRSQKTMVTATELSSKRQKLSSDFYVEEDTAVEAGNEETDEETPDDDDEASEYQPTQGGSITNVVDAVTMQQQSRSKENCAMKAESSTLHSRMTRSCRRNKDDQNAGCGRHDGVADNVSTTRERQGSNINNAKWFLPCPYELEKSIIDRVPIQDNLSVDIDLQRVKGGKDEASEDEPWGAADNDALFGEESSNGDALKRGITLTRNVPTIYTQNEDSVYGDYKGASVEEEDLSDKHNVKQGPIGANEIEAAVSNVKALSFVEFNTRYISTADKGIILAEIRNEEDSEPTTPSQSKASHSQIPLSAVSLSSEKLKSPSGFVKGANALPTVRSSIMLKLSKKIKDVNEAVKQLGLMMEEVHGLASSAELTYGRDLN